MKELIERIEAASEGSRELDFAVIKAAFGAEPGPLDMHTGEPLFLLRGLIVGCDFYTTSIDAAMTLVPEGWEWAIESGGHVEMTASRLRGPSVEGNAATPALALCAAALRAKQDGGGR